MAKTEQNDIRAQLDEILSRRIMILDGSMGALIYTYQLTEEDVRGSRFARHGHPIKNCTEALVLTQPRIIEDIHRAYLEAGADIIETDTFNGTGVSLEEFGLQEHVFELNKTKNFRKFNSNYTMKSELYCTLVMREALHRRKWISAEKRHGKRQNITVDDRR